MVFEGAFDRLFNIMKEEGGSEGGIIVQVHILLSFELVGVVIQNGQQFIVGLLLDSSCTCSSLLLSDHKVHGYDSP